MATAQFTRFKTKIPGALFTTFRTRAGSQLTLFKTAPLAAQLTRFRTKAPAQFTTFAIGTPVPLDFETVSVDSLRRLSVLVVYDFGYDDTDPDAPVPNVTADVIRYGSGAVVPSNVTVFAAGVTLTFEAEVDDLYRFVLYLDGMPLLNGHVPVLISARAAWREENRRVGTDGSRGEGTEVTGLWKQLLARMRGTVALCHLQRYEEAYRLIQSLNLIVEGNHQQLAGQW